LGHRVVYRFAMHEHLHIRTCTRTGCRWPAAASLSYRYASRQAWLLDLPDESDPSLYDLCPHHADHLTVPRGWERVDERTVTEAMVELSHADRAAVHEPAREHASSRGGSRYAALAADLPRIARECGTTPPEEATADPPPEGARPERAGPDGDLEHAPAQAHRVQQGGDHAPAARAHAVVPSRELAPFPLDALLDRSAVRQAAAPAGGARRPAEQQLSMLPAGEPPEEPSGGPAGGGAVVVTLDAAGRRRGHDEH
jgi:hypothetical protein